MNHQSLSHRCDCHKPQSKLNSMKKVPTSNNKKLSQTKSMLFIYNNY